MIDIGITKKNLSLNSKFIDEQKAEEMYRPYNNNTRRLLKAFLCSIFTIICLSVYCFAQNKFENKHIERVDIVFEGNDRALSASEQFRLIATNEVGKEYSTVRVRNALAKLYETKRIVSAKVQAEEFGKNKVILRFIIKRKSLAKRITIEVGKFTGETVTEQELLSRLNLLTPGSTVTERDLRENANVILTYLRERGFFSAEVNFETITLDNDINVEVVFKVKPNAQAKVADFKIKIDKFDVSKTETESKLKLRSGTLYSRQKLNADMDKIREALRDENYLAPRLDEPRLIYDGDTNAINIELFGQVGAKVEVVIDIEKKKIGEKAQRRLLPIKREGTIDFSAIVEGQRRLEFYYQEKGFFFARVTPYCSVTPAFRVNEASATENDTELLCEALSGADLRNREVQLKYDVSLNRRLRLNDIRLEGTDKLAIRDIQSVLESQKASLLGLIPILGYGRGVTSIELLKKDQATITALLRELGYRNARVGFKQGVSIKGDGLIITFVVREGIPTIIDDVEIKGNTSFSDDILKAELSSLVGKKFSRARARNGLRKLSEFYSTRGFYDARVDFSIVEYPKDDDLKEEKVKIIYKLRNEDKKVFVNRVLINGAQATQEKSILKAIDLSPYSVLRTNDIFASEQSLFATDVFERVEIKTEPAGATQDGKNRQTDIIINLEEKAPRLITYGGGYSTDFGLSGFFDIRHFNLFGKLQQGGAQIRWSQRQQLVQVDFLSPRFIPDGKDENGKKQFSSLTFTAQYHRDSTVTRFFRSTFDSGTFGVVQRIDENGVPIDEFGVRSGDPTLNRFTLSLETSRTISRKKRSILFVKYKFEDVRLFNIDSLLIKDLLRPDDNIRISGIGATFVLDTRKNCSIRNTLLEIIAKGEPGDPCRYNASDPTNGDYLTAEYDVSIPALGANIGFNKFQVSYNKYYTLRKLKNITLAGRAVFGLANVFSTGRRFSSAQFPGLEGSLPISERFFAGGSTTLRGFEFEAAGPRVAIVPQGVFRNQRGEVVNLSPFTIPFGGNALAIVNLEARVPISKVIRIVPFYDGGNVFRRINEIFNPKGAPTNNVFTNNLRAVWSNTIGLGFRIKTPIGGEFAVDYGYLLNPQSFVIPQQNPPNGILRLHQGQIHFRFSQAF